jgi:hypothetical protein
MRAWAVFLLNVLVLAVIVGVLISWILPGLDLKKKKSPKGNPPK